MIFNVAKFFLIHTSISVQNQSYLYTLKFLFLINNKIIFCLFVLVDSNRFIRSKWYTRANFGVSITQKCTIKLTYYKVTFKVQQILVPYIHV